MELIDVYTQWWNVPLVEEIFMKEEAEVMCNMMISPDSQHDKLVWVRTKNWIFSVYSAYHLAQSMGEQRKGSSSVVGCVGNIWQNIWTVTRPHIMQMFL
jgi:hypothetical protein